MVEAAGRGWIPWRASSTRSLRPPQVGCCARRASTAASRAGAVRAGLWCGRRDRSAKPAGPSAAKRRNHL